MSSIAQQPQAYTAFDQIHGAATLKSWLNRLVARGVQLSTGKQGASLQQVMDDLRG